MVKFSRVLQAVFVLQPLSATIPFNLGAANDSLTSEFKYLSDIDATSPSQTLNRGVTNQNQVKWGSHG